MGAETGDPKGNLTDEQHVQVIEGLFQSLAAQAKIPYEPPSEEKFSKAPIEGHRVVTGD